MSMAPAAAVAGLWIASGVLGAALARAPLGMRLRAGCAIVLSAVPLGAPFLLTGQAGWVRFLVAVQSALCAFRLFDLCARASDAKAQAEHRSNGRRVLADVAYIVVWPSLDRSRAFRRLDGERAAYVKSRALRAGVYGLTGGLLLALGARLELPERLPAAHSFLGACEIFLLGTALSDTVVAAFALAGFWIDDLFDYPMPPRSLLDFWGRNDLQFHHWLKQYVFRPFARRRRPALGVLAVFAFSGVGHEYLILASVPEMFGRQLAFFMLNGFGCLLGARLERSHRDRTGRTVSAVTRSTLAVAFLVATSPLLFSSLDGLLHFHGAMGGWLLHVLLTPLPSI